uniref:Uncharacterized protein n=1 Tax=Anguilla anguilla TaxID=7936 RepID=A0A0E9TNM3_ANGAN
MQTTKYRSSIVLRINSVSICPSKINECVSRSQILHSRFIFAHR